MKKVVHCYHIPGRSHTEVILLGSLRLWCRGLNHLQSYTKNTFPVKYLDRLSDKNLACHAPTQRTAVRFVCQVSIYPKVGHSQDVRMLLSSRPFGLGGASRRAGNSR
jgi:hypothetical protein